MTKEQEQSVGTQGAGDGRLGGLIVEKLSTPLTGGESAALTTENGMGEISPDGQVSPKDDIMHAVRAIPLLSEERQYALGMILVKARRARAMLAVNPDMRADRRVALEQRIAQEERAQNELIFHNMRLILGIAAKYAIPSFSYDDCFQEGVIGLIRTVQDWDPRKGAFSTHATSWIRQSITRARSEKATTIRLPDYIYLQMRNMRAAIVQLQSRGIDNPTVEQIAEATGLSIAQVQKLQHLGKHRQIASLDEPITVDGDKSLHDFAADKRASQLAEALEEEARRADLHEALSRALARIFLRSKGVLRLRFGLENGEPMTLEEAGHALNILRERIRQLQERGLRELREQAGGLREFATEEKHEQSFEHFQDVLASWKQLADNVPLVERNSMVERRRAASRLVRDVFIDLSPRETTELSDRWINAYTLGIESYRNQGTIFGAKHAIACIALVLSKLDLHETVENNKAFADLLSLLNREKPVEQNTYQFSQIMLLLLLVSETRYIPEYAGIFIYPRSITDSLPYIEWYAERLIANLVVEDIEKKRFEYHTIEPRSLRILRDFLSGKTRGQIVRELGISETKGTRKSIVMLMHQFSFGSPRRTPEFIKRKYIDTYGMNYVINRVNEFIRQLMVFKPERVEGAKAQKSGYELWCQCKPVAIRWKKYERDRKEQVLSSVFEHGDMVKAAELIGVPAYEIHAFWRCFDQYELDGLDCHIIFSNDPKVYKRVENAGLVDRERAIAEFEGTIAFLEKSYQLVEILPPRAKSILDYMRRYIEARATLTEKQTMRHLMREFACSSTFIYTLFNKSVLFCDFIRRLRQFEGVDRWNNPIMRAWRLLHFVDYAEGKLTKRAVSTAM